jgi:hypothetical protein
MLHVASEHAVTTCYDTAKDEAFSFQQIGSSAGYQRIANNGQ